MVFSQTVLYHIADPEKALAEIKRVLRPGALVALRDAINASIMIWPDDPLVRELGRQENTEVCHEEHEGGR